MAKRRRTSRRDDKRGTVYGRSAVHERLLLMMVVIRLASRFRQSSRRKRTDLPSLGRLEAVARQHYASGASKRTAGAGCTAAVAGYTLAPKISSSFKLFHVVSCCFQLFSPAGFFHSIVRRTLLLFFSSHSEFLIHFAVTWSWLCEARFPKLKFPLQLAAELPGNAKLLRGDENTGQSIFIRTIVVP